MAELNEAGGAGAPPPLTKDKHFAVRIETLRFESDHKMLKDNTADWTKNGAVFPKPEWSRSPKSNAPISHTRKKALKVTATFTVTLPHATPTNGTAHGTGGRRYLTFDAPSASYAPGNETKCTVEASAPLPDFIGRFRAAFAWHVTADGLRYAAGASGAHLIYVTYGDPIVATAEDGVTLRRMDTAINWTAPEWARGVRKPVDLIEKIFEKFPGYRLGTENLPPDQQRYLALHPDEEKQLLASGFPQYWLRGNDPRRVWPLADWWKFGAECQAIVRFAGAIGHQVGLAGTFEAKFVNCQPSDPFKPRILDHGNAASGPDPRYGYALVDGDGVVVGREYGKRDGVGFNNYEAFLKYTDDAGQVTWFGGGPGREPTGITDEQLLLDTFWGLAAFTWVGPDAAGGYKRRIVQVWPYAPKRVP